MADCGASGTAIDRAARALIGGGGGGGSQQQQVLSKQVASLLGNASMASSMGSAMPMVAPNQLALPPAVAVAGPTMQGRIQSRQQPQKVGNGPIYPHHPVRMGAQHHQSMDAAWTNGSQFMNSPPPAMLHPGHFTQQPPMSAGPHMQMQHQQMMMMQQQMQMQMQFQQQMMNSQVMKQQQRQNQNLNQQQDGQSKSQTRTAAEAEADTTTATQAEADKALDDWHDGLEQDFGNELNARRAATAAGAQQSQQQGSEIGAIGDEGNVQGVAMEELTAAWAQAESEYEDLDPAANMWNSTTSQYDDIFGDGIDIPEPAIGMGIAESAPYRFVNQVEEGTQQQQQQQPPVDWMAEGMKHFREGNLKDAIRSFEMELQHQNSDNSLAWRMLGKCHAENDQDPDAIKCLEAAVDRDPYSTDALLALGVSYVNELQHDKALDNLKAWITNNPKYAGLDLDVDVAGQAAAAENDIYSAASSSTINGQINNNNKNAAFEEVKSLLLRALEYDASDADKIHEALGVVYNVSKDYESAAESFRKVLQLRPDDYQVWNKLGATLANGDHSDQALPAYHEAIQLKPKYARAWLNMAISHSNLRNNDQAARCYLQALSLNPRATHCWSYLRMVLSSSEKWDLLPLVFNQDLAGFQQHYDFVLY